MSRIAELDVVRAAECFASNRRVANEAIEGSAAVVVAGAVAMAIARLFQAADPAGLALRATGGLPDATTAVVCIHVAALIAAPDDAIACGAASTSTRSPSTTEPAAAPRSAYAAARSASATAPTGSASAAGSTAADAISSARPTAARRAPRSSRAARSSCAGASSRAAGTRVDIGIVDIAVRGCVDSCVVIVDGIDGNLVAVDGIEVEKLGVGSTPAGQGQVRCRGRDDAEENQMRALHVGGSVAKSIRERFLAEENNVPTMLASLRPRNRERAGTKSRANEPREPATAYV